MIQITCPRIPSTYITSQDLGGNRPFSQKACDAMYVSLLPVPGKYHTANINALIFLAVESNKSLTTIDAIADEIWFVINTISEIEEFEELKFFE